VLGGTITGFGGWFFVKESKHWDLRHQTAERLVTGGFLFGFALMLLGFQVGTHTGRAGQHAPHQTAHEYEGSLAAAGWLVGAGAADLTLFLLVGLMFAYAPQMRVRRRLARTRVERRYAVDDKLNEIDDHPCPRVDGFKPVVVLRMRDGRTRTMVCNESAYELLRVGREGTAVIRGNQLERFL
jgi:hypothetical protein